MTSTLPGDAINPLKEKKVGYKAAFFYVSESQSGDGDETGRGGGRGR